MAAAAMKSSTRFLAIQPADPADQGGIGVGPMPSAARVGARADGSKAARSTIDGISTA